ncbi:MAG: hypothetical protein MJ061_01905 [Mailhella sp.]|nr:hypothetical protein [Mailhella sp.]
MLRERMRVLRKDAGTDGGDLGTVAGAARAFFFLCACAAGLFLVFVIDMASSVSFKEYAPTEICQTLLLAACTAILFLEARRRPGMRRALVLAAGLTGCMLIREQDFFLDFIAHGCWKWPALALAGGCLTYACTDVRNTLRGMAELVRHREFPCLAVGLMVVLVYSRLFGMGMLWNGLLGSVAGISPESAHEAVRLAKTAMEESGELLGYMLISWFVWKFRRQPQTDAPDDAPQVSGGSES